jgi:hypothetical protein
MALWRYIYAIAVYVFGAERFGMDGVTLAVSY